MDKRLQSTGYFRCKHCNSAGNWELTNELRITILTALLARDMPFTYNRFEIGEYRIYDGSKHRYVTDAEEYLLKKISASHLSKSSPVMPYSPRSLDCREYTYFSLL